MYKKSQGNIRLNPLRMMKPEPTPVLRCTVSLSIRICDDSTSKLIILPTFRIVDISSQLILKVVFLLLFRRSPPSRKSFTKKLTILETLILKCYSESSTLLPVLQENFRSASGTLVKCNLSSYAIHQPNNFNCLELYCQQTGAQH